MRNKFLTKILGATLGLAMAVGVGVGVANYNNREAKEVNATTSPLTFSTLGNSKVGQNKDQTMSTTEVTELTEFYYNSTYTFKYYKGKKQGDAILLTKKAGYFFNVTPMPDDIAKVNVQTASGAAAAAKYGVAFSSTVFESFTPNTTTANITNGGNHDYTCSIDNARYFCVYVDSNQNNNGQVQNLVVTFKSGQQLTPMTAPTLSLSGTVVSWDNIAGNNGYSYSITGAASKSGNLAANTTSLDVSTLGLAYGDYSITVVTKGDGTSTSDSAASDAQAFTLSEPTVSGSFNLFTGDLVEGDYVIYYNGYAMKNVITSNRFGYSTVAPSNNTISNPAVSIVWHIAKDGDYWTIYNSAVEKYAAGTSTKNQGALIESVTDYAKWTATGSSTYNFENKGRAEGASDTGNKWLRNNGNSGFACYASGTGGALSLYRKYVAYTIQYNANGGSGDAMANSETIVSECTFTAPSGKEFDHWNTAPDNSGTSYSAGDYVTTSCTLYAIWRNLVPAVSINKNTVDLTIGGSSDTVTASTTNIDNPSFTWAYCSGDECVSLENSNTATVTISVANEVSKVSTCVVRLTVNGKLGGVDITPITKDVNVTILRTSSAEDPFTVAEAKTAIDKLSTISDAYVAGKISSVNSFNQTYHSITYWIDDDSFEVYGGLNFNGTNFADIKGVEIGADVIVNGDLKKFNDTYEFDKNNKLVFYSGPTLEATKEGNNITSASLVFTTKVNKALWSTYGDVSEFGIMLFKTTKNPAATVKERYEADPNPSNPSNVLVVNAATYGLTRDEVDAEHGDYYSFFVRVNFADNAEYGKTFIAAPYIVVGGQHIFLANVAASVNGLNQ